MILSTLATLGAIAGLVASIMLLVACIIVSGSLWPLTALLALATASWFLPWEVWREKRRQTRRS